MEGFGADPMPKQNLKRWLEDNPMIEVKKDIKSRGNSS
jgi:hypothetical protein